MGYEVVHQPIASQAISELSASNANALDLDKISADWTSKFMATFNEKQAAFAVRLKLSSYSKVTTSSSVRRRATSSRTILYFIIVLH